MTAAGLVVSGLTVAYGGATALDDVSLEVAPGEVVALLGANGAGKSTTMRAVMGLVPARGGHILLDGRAIDALPPEGRARAGLGYAPEGRRVFAGLTVRENIEVAVDDTAYERRVRVDAMFALFPALEEKAAERAWRLSGGQQQMLSIARALASGPRILLLDEPSLGLAPRVADEVFVQLCRIASEGVGVLLAEQNAVRALALANRAVVLNRGRVAWRGEARDPDARAALDLALAPAGGTP